MKTKQAAASKRSETSGPPSARGAARTRRAGTTPPTTPPTTKAAHARDLQLSLSLFSRFTVYFDEVVRWGSIRRASEHLSISPSAIDRHILMVEENLGVPLFERQPRGLRLTSAGEIIVGQVRTWRKQLQHAQSQIEDLRGARRGTVSVVVAEGLTGFAAEALATFRSQHPGISQDLQTASSSRVCEMVREGRADVGLTLEPSLPDGLRVEHTLVHQVGAVVPSTHPLARHKEVSLSDCAQFDIIVPDETMWMRGPVDAVWKRTIGGELRGAIRANSAEMVKSLVRSHAGVGLLSPFDLWGEDHEGALRYILLKERKVPLSALSLITGTRRSLPPTVSLLTRVLTNFMSERRPASVA